MMGKTELNKQTAIRFVEAMGANDPQTAGDCTGCLCANRSRRTESVCASGVGEPTPRGLAEARNGAVSVCLLPSFVPRTEA